MAIDANEISEAFMPSLDDKYMQRFHRLIKKIEGAFPNFKNHLVQQEIAIFSAEYKESDCEALKYMIALRVLFDLTQQGWQLDVQSDDKLYLTMLTENSNDKAYVKSRLNSERKAQFSDPSILRFIERMETPKKYNGNTVSIRNLIGNKTEIIRKIQTNEHVIEPYLQLISHAIDEHTGYRDSDIWRYFRYTWSIPYKSMPGRNLFYLVRDAAQEFHPIVGIFALGNSVLNLTVRDDEIGWTIAGIKKSIERRSCREISSQMVSQTNGGTVGYERTYYLETEAENQKRVKAYSEKIVSVLLENLKNAIKDIYIKDLNYHRGTKNPTKETIDRLKHLSEELRELAIDNKKVAKVKNWETEAKETLFKKKRAAELSKLLDALHCFNEYQTEDKYIWLSSMIKTEKGRKAINVALVANRKTKIGSNMMEIIVCGAIPPYNELLGGKLISILACSPSVIRDYTEKYESQVSEIASRMKGKKIVRDSRLVFLGTTSLYSIGSSQYNRIKVPMSDAFTLEFKKMGITEGYGTVYFSKETTGAMMHLLELQDGGRRINNIFGEGTSPRFRLISRGLSAIGVKADAFLNHYSPRIVYSIELAENTNDFLLGYTEDIKYPFDTSNNDAILAKTQEMIDFWYNRWMTKRLETVDIVQRLESFTPEDILLSYTR